MSVNSALAQVGQLFGPVNGGGKNAQQMAIKDQFNLLKKDRRIGRDSAKPTVTAGHFPVLAKAPSAAILRGVFNVRGCEAVAAFELGPVLMTTWESRLQARIVARALSGDPQRGYLERRSVQVQAGLLPSEPTAVITLEATVGIDTSLEALECLRSLKWALLGSLATGGEKVDEVQKAVAGIGVDVDEETDVELIFPAERVRLAG